MNNLVKNYFNLLLSLQIGFVHLKISPHTKKNILEGYAPTL